jgi:hypothetical protein
MLPLTPQQKAAATRGSRPVPTDPLGATLTTETAIRRNSGPYKGDEAYSQTSGPGVAGGVRSGPGVRGGAKPADSYNDREYYQRPKKNTGRA